MSNVNRIFRGNLWIATEYDSWVYVRLMGLQYQSANTAIALQKVRCYSSLSLRLEPNNPRSGNAVAIYSGSKQLGYLPREIAAKIAPMMRLGTRYICQVVHTQDLSCVTLRIKSHPLQAGLVWSEDWELEDRRQQATNNGTWSQTLEEIAYSSNQ